GRVRTVRQRAHRGRQPGDGPAERGRGAGRAGQGHTGRPGGSERGDVRVQRSARDPELRYAVEIDRLHHRRLSMPDPSAFGLSDDELAEVETARITLPSGAQRSAVQLAASWAANIEKIDSDRARPADDRSVWTEHDLAGALFVRDSLETALRQLPDALRDK